MKILIIGGSGLIGSRLSKKLRESYDVDSPTSKEINLTYYDSIRNLPDKYELVIHCAQFRNYSKPNMSILELEDMLQINALSLSSLFENRKRLKMIIYFSTGGLYRTSQSILNEHSELKDSVEMNPYFTSKSLGESLLQEVQGNFDVCILRPFTVFGNNANISSLMPRIYKKIIDGERLQVSSSGGDFLRPTHVDDVANVIYKIIENRTVGVYNVGGPEVLTFEEIVTRMGSFYGLRTEFEYSNSKQHYLAPDNHLLHRDVLTPTLKFDGNWQV